MFFFFQAEDGIRDGRVNGVQTCALPISLRFGLGGSEYEIDLSKKNASRFRREIAPYIEHARKAGRGQRRRPVRAASSREHSGDIRAWAKDHGIAVSERGRIPASVVEQYQR